MTAREFEGKRFVTTSVEVEGREEEIVVEIPEFEPVPWSASARLETVGRRVPRVDGVTKVTGAARFTADIQLPGMLYGALLRAPFACGTVREVDAADARRLPGVHAVLTARDVADIEWLHGQPLLGSRIWYAGQPIAAVAAESPLAARRALAVMRLRASVRRHTAGVPPRGRPRRAPGAPGAPFTERRQRGRVAAALKRTAAVVTQTYQVPAALHQPLETHGSVAWWHGDRLTLYDSTQGIFRVRRQLADYLGLGVHQVRVISEHMGGGFGSKNDCGAHTVLAAVLARATGHPVKLLLDRAEQCLDTGHRPETVLTVTLGARRDGVLTAIDVAAWVALGADGWVGGPAQIAHRLYRCPNVRTVEHYCYTNAGPMSAFRAPYYVEGAFALESAMDLLARRLRMDPLELRRANLAVTDPDRGRPYSANCLAACYDEVERRIGWHKRRTRGAMREIPGAKVARGVGVAAQVWGAAGGPPAYAEVRINRDGTALVLTGTQDLGTGSRTVLAQIAAEALGLPLEGVTVALGDTDTGPYAPNSWGSMTTASVGPAVRMAAEDARRQLCEVAADLLGATPGGLVARRGRIMTSSRRKSIAIERVTAHLGNIMIVGRGHRGPNPQSVTVASFGAQAAEVEVDLETGVVRVLRIAAAHDCGRVVNPELAESQLHGGIVQGMGYALFERRIQDPQTGLVLNAGLHDYKVPTMADVPSIDARALSGSDPMANHTGAKGLAEPPIIPTAPAIANAVYDALGVQPTQLPLTPAAVLKLLRKRPRRRRAAPRRSRAG